MIRPCLRAIAAALEIARRTAQKCSGLLAAVALLGACASPPAIRLHTLLPVQPAAASPDAAGPALTIALARVVVPVPVDQPQWLVRLPDDTLAQLDNDRWASPLPDELRAALREALVTRWRAVEVPAARAAWRIAVEVTRFESIPGQQAWLESQWTLTPARGAAGAAASPNGAGAAENAGSVTCRTVLHEPASGGTLALAEAHRRAVAHLADQIGRQLRAAGRGESPACAGDVG